jgi:hypothetical protein
VTLIGNHYLRGASPTTDNVGSTSIGSMDRSHAYRPGIVRGFYVSEACGEDVQVQSFPPGYKHPSAWFLAPKSGGIGSRRGDPIQLTANAPAEAGMEIAGTAGVSLGATGSGELVSDGSGTATLTLTVAAAIEGAIDGSGTALFSISATAAIDALAEVSGSAVISMVAQSSIEGLGEISGHSLPYTDLSPQSLADAVWAANAAQSNASGTMGEKLNAAGAGGDPWAVTDLDLYDEGTAGSMLALAKAILESDKVFIPGTTPGTGTLHFYARGTTVDIIPPKTVSGTSQTQAASLAE